MATTYVDSVSVRNLMELPVTVDTMTVTVGLGTFSVAGSDYDFTEDQESVLPVETFDRRVSGFLVKDKATGDPSVLVDDVEDGDPGYDFENASPYQLLHQIFLLMVPANTSDLSTADLTVYRIKRPE